MNVKKLNELFANMDKWRHFPKYQLERHIDGFFALYLPEIVEEYLQEKGKNIKVDTNVIPEMPINKSIIKPERRDEDSNNQSENVDFLLFGRETENLKYAFFIELKTDMFSIRESQIQTLGKISWLKFIEVIQGLFDVALASNKKRKYYHLLYGLQKANIFKSINSNQPREIRKAIEEIKRKNIGFIEGKDILPQIIFVLPKTPDEEDKEMKWIKKYIKKSLIDEPLIIDFKFISDVLKGPNYKDDVVARLFSTCLEWWQGKAGSDNLLSVEEHRETISGLF